ncbi:MAG: hypothetical protein WCI18_10835 [Pseudomonadota bacterium]
MSVSPLGDLLVNMGLITPDDRTTIIRECGRSSQSFAKSIVRLGIIQEKDLPELLTKRAGAVKASPEDVRFPTREALNLIDRGLIAKLEVLPLKVEMGRLLIAMGDPLDRDTVSQVQFFVRKPVIALVANFSEIHEAIAKQLGESFTPSIPPLAAFLDRHSVRLGTQKIAPEEFEEELSLETTSAEFDFSEPTSTIKGKKNSGRRSAPELPSAGFQSLDQEDDDINMEYEKSVSPSTQASTADFLDSESSNEFDLHIEGELSEDLLDADTTTRSKKTLDENAILDDSFEFDDDELDEKPTVAASNLDMSIEEIDSEPLAKTSAAPTKAKEKVPATSRNSTASVSMYNQNIYLDDIDLEGLGDDDDISFDEENEGSNDQMKVETEALEAPMPVTSETQQDNARESAQDVSAETATFGDELNETDLEQDLLADLPLDSSSSQELDFDIDLQSETTSQSLDEETKPLKTKNQNSSIPSPISREAIKKAKEDPLVGIDDSDLADLDWDTSAESSSSLASDIEIGDEETLEIDETLTNKLRDTELLESIDFSDEHEDELGVALNLNTDLSSSKSIEKNDKITEDLSPLDSFDEEDIDDIATSSSSSFPSTKADSNKETSSHSVPHADASQKKKEMDSRTTAALSGIDSASDLLEIDLSLFGEDNIDLDDIAIETSTLDALEEVSISDVPAPMQKAQKSAPTTQSQSSAFSQVSGIINHGITSVFTADNKEEAANAVMEAMTACGASTGWWIHLTAKPMGYFWKDGELRETNDAELQTAKNFQGTEWTHKKEWELISIPVGTTQIVIAAQWNESTPQGTKSAVLNLFKRLVAMTPA